MLRKPAHKDKAQNTLSKHHTKRVQENLLLITSIPRFPIYHNTLKCYFVATWRLFGFSTEKTHFQQKNFKRFNISTKKGLLRWDIKIQRTKTAEEMFVKLAEIGTNH